MQRICEACGDTYTTSRNNARFCGDRCRKRAERNPGIVAKPDEPNEEPGRIEQLMTEELRAAGRLDTTMGAAAVELAHQFDHNGDRPGIASISKEFYLARDRALAGTQKTVGLLDEVKARRERRRSG